MDEIILNLQKIKEEKDKIVPEVIKAGVTIFGVTGTYTGEEVEEPEDVNEV